MKSQNIMPCPVALFVYNRPWHTKETITALARNPLSEQTRLIVFSDGPKSAEVLPQVQAVRQYLRTISGFASIEIYESPVNQGLAKSVISGITQVLKETDQVIVLEDDMVTSPFFLTYMNHCLNLYENDQDVISIHGYIYPVNHELPETFFLKGADCWGWATWRRGWQLFEPDGRKLLKEIDEKGLANEFDFYGSYPYRKMLKQQIAGKNDSWAIRWYASAFLKNKLTLYPGKSLIKNIGNDASGTHSWNQERFDHKVLADSLVLRRISLSEDRKAKCIVSNYLKTSSPSFFKKLLNKIYTSYKAI